MKITTLIYIEKILKENAGFDERMYEHSLQAKQRIKDRHEFEEDFTVKEKRELDEIREQCEKLKEKHITSRDAYEDFLSHDFR